MNNILIRDIRRKRGLTQAQLASRLGCTQAMISQLETGCRAPSSDTLAAIGDILRARKSDLERQMPLYDQVCFNSGRLTRDQLQAVNQLILEFLKRVN